jgi:SpoVK/Ycf46/Vps4 family AAA+-type ATPase
MSKINYIGFARMGNIYGPAHGLGDYTPTLPAGHYKVAWNRYTDELTVTHFVPRTDEILNLGCEEFERAVNLTTKFLSPEMCAAFERNGFLVKRSFFFYGPPGTGKSVLASKISDIAVKNKNAIAMYPDDFDSLERMLEVLDETDKNRFKVVCLEEFDNLIGRNEGDWTTLLDGQFQSSNRMVVATTNNIDNIPGRLLRPGRFSSITLIPPLSALARDNFLKLKNVSEFTRKHIVEKTDQFTIDDLKEVVQCGVILGEDLDSTIASIRAVKNLGKDDE